MKQSFADLSLSEKNEPTSPPESTQKNENMTPDENKAPVSTQKPSSTTQKPPETSPAPPNTKPSLPENALPIINMDLSYLSYGKNYLYNDTSLKLDLDKIRGATLTDRYSEDSTAPLVLVIHTHTTEAYMPEGATYYVNDAEIARSDSRSENMIAVGEEFVRVLEENGIKTLGLSVKNESLEDYYLNLTGGASHV
jgi:hypothetical protein